MHSLRTRITLLTVWMLVIAVLVVTLVSVVFIRNNGLRESNQILLLLCETGERNLDYYFDSVQKSVKALSTFVENDLDGIESDKLQAHIERVMPFFESTAYRTNGVLTYYYRIDPAVSTEAKGFWYTNTDGNGFLPHAVTDITLYDTQDTTRLVWFTVPKHTGQAIWLPPYITDNLNWRVISYNVPIYWRGTFVGVVGIEIDYSTMAEQVESIRLYKNGYAFLSDAEGNLFFHPRIDITALTPETMPATPEGLVSSSTFVSYTFEGVEKRAAWLSLTNGMRLNVAVPVSETEGDWQNLVSDILLVSLFVLLTLSLFTLYYTRRIVRPLVELTKAAEEVDQGNYDVSLTYTEDDEVGQLTNTFKLLTDHMKSHISDLNTRIYVDAMTSVKNKGAFLASIDALQAEVEAETPVSFAVGMFDCDNLKLINDQYGHDKGDVYLKTSCRLICRVFQHSPVFRVGGDEFAVILQDEDYDNRLELGQQFERIMAETRTSGKPWERVSVAMGIAAYTPTTDANAIDVVHRADKMMYTNKQARKQGRKG